MEDGYLGDSLKEILNPDAESRISAIRQLQGTLEANERKTLCHALHDAKYQVRTAAAEALVAVNEEEIVDALVMGLDDWNAQVRAACARALMGVTHPIAVRALYEGFRDRDQQVRAACAQAIESIRKAMAA